MDQTPGGEKDKKQKKEGDEQEGDAEEEAEAAEEEEAVDPKQLLTERIAALVQTTSAVVFNYTAQARCPSRHPVTMLDHLCYTNSYLIQACQGSLENGYDYVGLRSQRRNIGFIDQCQMPDYELLMHQWCIHR